MHYRALATDYDGTIADDGVVDKPTLAALERLRDGARRLILVTGRDWPTCSGSCHGWTCSISSSPKTVRCSMTRPATRSRRLATHRLRPLSSVCVNLEWRRCGSGG